MIHLIVGNTGAGKTTYAKNLKNKNQGVVFSIDEWNNTLFMPDKTAEDGVDWFLERIERAELMICNLLIQLENSGTDSILDLGFSKVSHRLKFVNFAKQNNFTFQFHYLDIPKDLRWNRVMKRNTEKGETYQFEVTQENLVFMERWFEIPTPKELKGAVIIKE